MSTTSSTRNSLPEAEASHLSCRAAALKVDTPCGLATLSLLELEDPFGVHDGEIAVPTAAGLMA